jgi:hypothetical protein
MAVDPNARQFILNFAGGSLRMPVGNAKHLFGENYELLKPNGVPYNKTIQSFKRTRVIGGPESTVKEHDRDYMKWPTSQANNAGAGKVAMMYWEGSLHSWQVRYTGAAADLASFLSTSSPKPVGFTTSRGTAYGVLIGDVNLGD